MDNIPSLFRERMEKILPAEMLHDFFESMTRPLPKTIRTVSSFDTPSDWQLRPVSYIPHTYFITRDDQTVPLGNTPEHIHGEIYVAGLSSLLPPLLLDPDPTDKVLDMCAAPGSKTTLLSELMNGRGAIIANEPSSTRSKKLVSNIERMGCTNVLVTQYDGQWFEKNFGQEFDRILLDAPCSSESHGRKNSRFFETVWKERKIFEAAKLQKKLIKSAFLTLRYGGTLVYSTCTSAPEENELVVQSLLDEYGDAVEIMPVSFGDIPFLSGIPHWDNTDIDPNIVKNVARIYPHMSTDEWDGESFFLTKIRKRHPLKIPPPNKNHPPSPQNTLSKKEKATIVAYFKKTFGIPKEIFSDYTFCQSGTRIFVGSSEVCFQGKKIPHRRLGIFIYDTVKGVTTSFAFHFGKHSQFLSDPELHQRYIQLTDQEKIQWIGGYDLTWHTNRFPENKDSDTILVFWNHRCVGTGKVMSKGKKLKNKVDRSRLVQSR